MSGMPRRTCHRMEGVAILLTLKRARGGYHYYAKDMADHAYSHTNYKEMCSM